MVMKKIAINPWQHPKPELRWCSGVWNERRKEREKYVCPHTHTQTAKGKGGESYVCIHTQQEIRGNMYTHSKKVEREKHLCVHSLSLPLPILTYSYR